MSEQQEVKRLKVILIDDGGWVSKTFIHEVKENRKDVDIQEIIKVEPLEPLKTTLDRIQAPAELEVFTDEETGVSEVMNKQTIWLPFTSEGCKERNIAKEMIDLKVNDINGEYPYLSVALYYGQMSRSWLHELARKAEIVPINHMVDEEGKSREAPKKITPENTLIQTLQNKAHGKFKIRVLKKQTPPPTDEFKVKDQVPEGAGVPTSAEVESNVEAEKTKKVNKKTPQ